MREKKWGRGEGGRESRKGEREEGSEKREGKREIREEREEGRERGRKRERGRERNGVMQCNTILLIHVLCNGQHTGMCIRTFIMYIHCSTMHHRVYMYLRESQILPEFTKTHTHSATGKIGGSITRQH